MNESVEVIVFRSILVHVVGLVILDDSEVGLEVLGCQNGRGKCKERESERSEHLNECDGLGELECERRARKEARIENQSTRPNIAIRFDLL